MNERDEAHYRTMLAGGASVNAQLAAAAVYAASGATVGSSTDGAGAPRRTCWNVPTRCVSDLDWTKLN